MNKAKGGQPLYEPTASVPALIEPSLGHELQTCRERVRQIVKTPGAVGWQGVSASELGFNHELQRGPDFGGRQPGSYLPALSRYEGRFFQTLGPDRQANTRSSEHHMLFVSGLYGLVSVDEPIQLYCCPLTPAVAGQWAEVDLLTRVVCDYAQRHNILRIIELTAVMAYRNLINWNLVSERGIDVLHCFSTMSSGDSALIPFAQLLKGKLLGWPEDQLLAIQPEDLLNDVVFRSVKETREGLPSELKAILRAEREVPLLQSHRIEDLPHVLMGANVARAEFVCRPEEWLFSMTSEFRKDCVKNKSLASRVLGSILEICRDPMKPRGDTVKPLSGHLKGKWRYRIADYRIVYLPNPANRTIYLLKASPRGESGLYD